MRKLLFLFCMPLLCLSCSKSGSDKPIMEIVGIYIDGDEEEINYVDQFNKIPDLETGDVIDILFTLDGNGDDLRSFIVSNDNSTIETVLFFIGDEVSPEFSELNNGIAVFVDGVNETGVTVKVKVKASLTNEKPISFHLNPKSPDSESAIIGVELKSKLIFYPEILKAKAKDL